MTWKTVKRLWKKLSKFALGFSSPLSPWNSLNFPPKSCDPSKANIPSIRKSRSSKDAIASMELIKDLSRFWRAFQYLLKINILHDISLRNLEILLSLYILSDVLNYQLDFNFTWWPWMPLKVLYTVTPTCLK